MARKAAKWIGLILVGAAAFSCLRSFLRRHDDSGPDEPAPDAPRTHLTPVPDAEPEPDAQPDADSYAQPEPEHGSDAERRWVPPVDEACPPGYPIKVNERSGIYHVPGGLSYDRTSPTRCYPDEAAAEADGFRRAKR